MRACWGPDPVSFSGRFYTIAPSEVNPKPVQDRIPVLVGAMTPGGIRRAARIADGINPIALSAEALDGMLAGYRAALEEAGKDPGSGRVVVRANVPLTAEPLGAGRPFLGGSAAQVAADIAGLEGVDEVLIANVGRRSGVDEEIELMAGLHAAVTS
jgi:alkanesulfonate monooxygenase SsuD/methylene tetrahydromethanopterin reductase-like flavin-dependent oxidoreductase (luciferase family)